MSNQFVQLPLSAADGPGTAVNVSGLGALKTVVVAGSWTFAPNITIEINSSPTQSGSWAALETFQGAGSGTFEVVCLWMRARLSNFKGGQAPIVYVAAQVDTASIAALDVPAVSGIGASFDISAVGPFKTAWVGGSFGGAVNIEVSNDGGTTWGPAFSFQQGSPGIQSAVIIGELMRVKRVGVPALNPGLPSVVIAAGSVPGTTGEGAVQQPTFASPVSVNYVYVRSTGSDLTGNGTLANPYGSVAFALRTIPLEIPPGVRYEVDCTGSPGAVFTETFVSGYHMPAFKAASSIDTTVPSTVDPFFRRRSAITIRAGLIPFGSIPEADTSIAASDCTLAADADDRLYKLTLNVARSSWATTVTGTGDSFAVTTGLVTLTDSAGLFTSAMVGNLITIAGATSGANDGTYMVHSFVSATQIKYINVGGVAEAFAGTWTVKVGLLKGAIFHASNDGTSSGAGAGDGVVAYNTDTELFISVSDKNTGFALTAPYQLMQQSAIFQGQPTSAGGTAGGFFNIINVDSFTMLGIKFINLSGASANGFFVRSAGASIFAISFCDFSARVVMQGCSAYRIIIEDSYFHGAMQMDVPGANLTMNACVFDGIISWATIPSAGYLAIYDSHILNFVQPFGDQRPLLQGNFQAPTSPAGAGLSIFTKFVRVQNGKTHGILSNGGGSIEFTKVVNCNGDGARVDRASGPVRLGTVKGNNNTGIGVNLLNGSSVDRNTATTVTGLGGDYKVGANAASAGGGGGWTALGSGQENDLAAGATSEMCRLFTS